MSVSVQDHLIKLRTSSQVTPVKRKAKRKEKQKNVIKVKYNELKYTDKIISNIRKNKPATSVALVHKNLENSQISSYHKNDE